MDNQLACWEKKGGQPTNSLAYMHAHKNASLNVANPSELRMKAIENKKQPWKVKGNDQTRMTTKTYQIWGVLANEHLVRSV